ncbi:hypothetical protein AEQ67_13630 [Pseudomonas sp. RIT-PI-q]|nr:hypothetical protein AEQ67_13630 [Pseudomonas sp. RIT-PI-q]
MAVDWNLVSSIGVPVACLFLGAWVTRRFEKRPEIVSYYGHASSFSVPSATGSGLIINTHAVVLRNVGKRSASNVRMTHATLPSVTVFPHTPYRTEELPGGGIDLIFPTIVPGAQITVSYLYFAPLLVSGVNIGIKHDDGFAKAIPVILQRQLPLWVVRLFTWVAAIGAVTIAYGAVKAVIFLEPLVVERMQSL